MSVESIFNNIFAVIRIGCATTIIGLFFYHYIKFKQLPARQEGVAACIAFFIMWLW